MGVDRRGAHPVMAQQRLNDPGVRARFQQVGGIAMPQRMRRDPRQTRPSARPLTGPLHRARIQRLIAFHSRKQPLLGLHFLPVVTQLLEQDGRQRQQAFCLPFAEDAQHHLPAVNAGGRQVQGFLETQAGGVDGPQHQSRPGAAHRRQETGHFLA